MLGSYARIRFQPVEGGERVRPTEVEYLVEKEGASRSVAFEDQATRDRASQGLPVRANRVRVPRKPRRVLRRQALDDGSFLLGPFEPGTKVLHLSVPQLEGYDEQIELVHGEVVLIEPRLVLARR